MSRRGEGAGSNIPPQAICLSEHSGGLPRFLTIILQRIRTTDQTARIIEKYPDRKCGIFSIILEDESLHNLK